MRKDVGESLVDSKTIFGISKAEGQLSLCAILARLAEGGRHVCTHHFAAI